MKKHGSSNLVQPRGVERLLTRREALVGSAVAVGAAGIAGALGTAPAAAQQAGHAPFPRIPKDLRPGGAFDRFVEEQAAQKMFSGVVLLAYAGEPVLARSFGWSDSQQTVPNSPYTMFPFASVNKIFNAVAIAQLAEQGLVDFSAPIGVYLDAVSQEVGEAVTIHHVLTHTSGLREQPGGSGMGPGGDPEGGPQPGGPQPGTPTPPGTPPMVPNEVLRALELDYVPGSTYRYSNAYTILGAIVEAVTGIPTDTYIRENIFLRAGMIQAVTEGANVGRGISVGGVSGGSSALELLSFVKALWGGTLLTPTFTELISSGKYPVPAKVQAGDGWPGPNERHTSMLPNELMMAAYGMDVYVVNDQRVIRRTGTGGIGAIGEPGIRNSISVYPDLDWVAIILANIQIDILSFQRLHDGIITEQARPAGGHWVPVRRRAPGRP